MSESNKGNPIGIVALNKVGPHEILGGGTGTFVVSGDIVVNTNVSQQPWTSSSAGWEWDDAIDAKTNSNLYVYGTIHVPAANYNGEPLWPLDHCFQGAGIVGKGNPGAPAPAYQSGDPGAGLPAFQPACNVGSVTVDYNAIDPTITQITDPLAGTGAPPNPLTSADASCPGMQSVTVTQRVADGVGVEAGHLHEPGGAHRLRELRGLLRLCRRRRLPRRLRIPAGPVDRPPVVVATR